MVAHGHETRKHVGVEESCRYQFATFARPGPGKFGHLTCGIYQQTGSHEVSRWRTVMVHIIATEARKSAGSWLLASKLCFLVVANLCWKALSGLAQHRARACVDLCMPFEAVFCPCTLSNDPRTHHFADRSCVYRGRVVSDAKLRQPKLTCRNWESGILVPVDLDNATKTQKLWDEGTDEARPHFGDENEERDTGILSKAHSDNASISDQCMTPTFVKKVAMQVKAGKREDATYWHQQTGGSGEVIASGRSTMAIAMGGTSQQEHMNTSQELPSLGKAFAEAVPVPIQHPAPSHVARQQKPWFFMG